MTGINDGMSHARESDTDLNKEADLNSSRGTLWHMAENLWVTEEYILSTPLMSWGVLGKLFNPLGLTFLTYKMQVMIASVP